MRRAVTLVGIGDDGCAGLTSRAMNAITKAQVLAGGERQLAFFPDFQGERVVFKDSLGAAIERIASLAEDHNVCILASGDPLFYGIGGLVIKKLGAEHVEVIPQPSSMQLAFARAGLTWDDAAFISLHGRPLFGLATRLKRLSKAGIFTDPDATPGRIAAHLIAHGETGWQAWLCEDLGGPEERVRGFSIAELAEVTDAAPLNVLVLVRTDPRWRPPSA
ncbi:MAG: precorrin-6y C5,15-methyltransferase (decarboxylating) subunit CbiE, partial [Gammaproteobacteria bacterium]